MIEVTEHSEGCILAVRAQPGARRAGVRGEKNGALEVAVTAPPEEGRANQALVEVLREVFQRKRSEVELLTGQTNRNKRFLLRGLTPDQLREQLQRLLG